VAKSGKKRSCHFPDEELNNKEFGQSLADCWNCELAINLCGILCNVVSDSVLTTTTFYFALIVLNLIINLNLTLIWPWRKTYLIKIGFQNISRRNLRSVSYLICICISDDPILAAWTQTYSKGPDVMGKSKQTQQHYVKSWKTQSTLRRFGFRASGPVMLPVSLLRPLSHLYALLDHLQIHNFQ